MQYLQKHFKKVLIPFLILGGFFFSHQALAYDVITSQNNTTAHTATNWISEGTYGTNNPNGRGFYFDASIAGDLSEYTTNINLYNSSGGSGDNQWSAELLDDTATPLDCISDPITVADAYSGTINFTNFAGAGCALSASTEYIIVINRVVTGPANWRFNMYFASGADLSHNMNHIIWVDNGATSASVSPNPSTESEAQGGTTELTWGTVSGDGAFCYYSGLDGSFISCNGVSLNESLSPTALSGMSAPTTADPDGYLILVVDLINDAGTDITDFLAACDAEDEGTCMAAVGAANYQEVLYVVEEDPVIDSISFNTPPIPDASQFPFSQWSVDYQAIEAGDTIKINVCPELTSCPRYDVLAASLIATQEPITKIVAFSAPLSPGVTYTATAYLMDGDVELATDEVTFSVSYTTPYGTGSSTSAFDPSVLNCDQYAFIESYDAYITDFPFFASTTPQRITCEAKSFAGAVVSFMFVPGQIADSVGVLQTNIEAFKTVFPFSVYYSVTGSVEEGIASSTADATLSVDLPSLSGATVTEVDVLTENTITDALTTTHCDADCAEGIKTRLFNWIKVIIWTSAGITAVAIII